MLISDISRAVLDQWRQKIWAKISDLVLTFFPVGPLDIARTKFLILEKLQQKLPQISRRPLAILPLSLVGQAEPVEGAQLALRPVRGTRAVQRVQSRVFLDGNAVEVAAVLRLLLLVQQVARLQHHSVAVANVQLAQVAHLVRSVEGVLPVHGRRQALVGAQQTVRLRRHLELVMVVLVAVVVELVVVVVQVLQVTQVLLHSAHASERP